MKRDIVEYVALYDTCQRVKAEHQRLARLPQPLKIPKWKMEVIGMDFIVQLYKDLLSWLANVPEGQGEGARWATPARELRPNS
jgi:hypothetical protein